MCIRDRLKSYLNGLKQSQPGCLILAERDLSDFDFTELINAFGKNGVTGIDDLTHRSESDTMCQSQIRTLLERYGATHAYLASYKPLHIALGHQRNMVKGPDTELLAAFGLSRLIAERDCLRSL